MDESTLLARQAQAKALASGVRLHILWLLKDPAISFDHQTAGAPEDIGVCVTLLAEKLAISQPTMSRHLELLRRAGFVDVNRIGRWSFYSRNQEGLADYRAWINAEL